MPSKKIPYPTEANTPPSMGSLSDYLKTQPPSPPLSKEAKALAVKVMGDMVVDRRANKHKR